jgi:hypothetical protein
MLATVAHAAVHLAAQVAHFLAFFTMPTQVEPPFG